MSEKMNLFQKIADVKANIDGFTKDTKGYQYTYVSGSQVLHKIRAKMVEHNLLFLPTIDNAEYKDVTVSMVVHLLILGIKNTPTDKCLWP